MRGSTSSPKPSFTGRKLDPYRVGLNQCYVGNRRIWHSKGRSIFARSTDSQQRYLEGERAYRRWSDVARNRCFNVRLI